MEAPLVIKIGTNVLTDEQGLLNTPILEQIVEQICTIKEQGRQVIIVSSGAMAAGRALLKPSEEAGSILHRQMLAAVGQAAHVQRYSEAFKKHDFLCAQVLTTKEDFRTRQHYLNMRNCFLSLLKDNVVPIVNENDVIAVEELMFTDNDELAGLISSMVDAEQLIILTTVEGVYEDGDEGKIIQTIAPGETNWKKSMQESVSEFGKGGMITKCAMASKLASTGIGVHIISGTRENAIIDVLQGNGVGTHFQPSKKASTVKRWIANAEGNEKGSVTVNSCTLKLLQSDETISLLPVGIIAVEGEFEKGDVIEIRSMDGEKIALGKAQYDAKKTASVLEKKGEKPLVHYDYLYVL